MLESCCPVINKRLKAVTSMAGVLRVCGCPARAPLWSLLTPKAGGCHRTAPWSDASTSAGCCRDEAHCGAKAPGVAAGDSGEEGGGDCTRTFLTTLVF